MSLAQKKFRNNLTGDVVTVIDSFEHIAILENKQRLDTKILLNPSLYTEEINPESFFETQNSYDMLASKIRSIDTSNLRDDTTGEVYVNSGNGGIEQVSNESAIVMSTEEDEKAALARKYGASVDNYSSLSKQNEAFASILGDDSDLPEVPKVFHSETPIEPEVQRIEVNRDTPTRQMNEMRIDEDPMLKMFKGVKRILDFNMNLDVTGKIPRLDFIEMMEDSYETSIIDFLANEFTRSVIDNPAELNAKIKSALMVMVYGDIPKTKKETVKKETTESTEVEKPKRKYSRKAKNDEK